MNGHILLLPNAHRDEGLQATLGLAEHLRSHGHETRIAPFLSEDVRDTWDPAIPTVSVEEGIAGARLVVSLGGDGTILQISRFLAGTGVPIIGVNMGNKGFLAELERTELLRVLEVAEGRCSVQARMMLDVELIRNGETVYSSQALNEAVVRATVALIRIEAYGDGREITAFSGDGIIVSSPTGSTAYSMAAGGPIVEPDANCIILTPICTFRLASRSVVLTPDRHVCVFLPEQNEKEALLTVDGESVPFLDGDELRVKRSDKTLLMAKISDRSFYDIVFEKLNDKN
jgi:NAD+ kinase